MFVRNQRNSNTRLKHRHFFDRTYDIFGIFRLKMADLNEQDLLDYDEEEQEVKDIKQKKDVKVKFLSFQKTRWF